MEYFSHSKIATFNQCKQKYKLQYIDKIKIKVPFTIEGFMGFIVHDCLEEAFKKRLNSYQKALINIDELLNLYKITWEKKFNKDIKIVNNSFEFYYEKGKKMLSDFYNNFFIADNLTTIALETKKLFSINQTDLYHIRIDRLAKDDKENLYIIDYKTSNWPKNKDQLKSDRQLMSYASWVNNNFKYNNLILQWNFLVNSTKINIEVDQKDIFLTQKKINEDIKLIKLEKNFEYNISKLCDWCIYKPHCKAWNTSLKSEQKQKSLLDF